MAEEAAAVKPVKAKLVKIQVMGELFDNVTGTWYRSGTEVEMTAFLQSQIDGGLARIEA